jgi:hypothetical protein
MKPLTLTPQSKLLAVADRLRIPSLANMQGSTGILYDTLNAPAAGTAGTLNFFEGVDQRGYPDTNLDTNELETGSAFAIEALCLGTIADADNALNPTSGGVGNLYIANQRVLKNFPLGDAFVNRGGISGRAATAFGVHYLEEPIVIPPQVRFNFQVELVVGSDIASYFLYLYGTRVLLNLKTAL